MTLSSIRKNLNAGIGGNSPIHRSGVERVDPATSIFLNKKRLSVPDVADQEESMAVLVGR